MLVPAGDDLNVNGTIHIRVKNGAKTWLGFVIESTAHVPLMCGYSASTCRSYALVCYLFSDSHPPSKSPWADNIHKSAFTKHPNKADPCILPGQLLTFTTSLYLPPGHDSDISYLKLFLTTKYVDLSHFEMPFQGRAESLSSSGLGMHRAARLLQRLNHYWGTLLIPIVQKRSD